MKERSAKFDALSKAALLVLALGILQGGLHQSSACLEPDWANDADYIAAGAAMQGRLLYGRVWVTDEATETFVASYNISAAYYNERCALTAAHNLNLSPGYKVVRIEVSTGSSYVTNRGVVVPSFRHTIHPSYDPLNSGAVPDVAIIYLAASLPGTNAVIGSASEGEVVLHGGFGGTATPSAPTIFYDGNSRGWFAPVQHWVDSRFSSTYYAQTDFTINSGTPALKGKGLGGDSGGPVYNNSGELVGLNKAQIGGTTGTGSTVYFKLTQSDVLNWISANTTNVAPNPPALSIPSPGVVSLTGDTNQIYGILASTTLANWAEIGLVTNLTGSVTEVPPREWTGAEVICWG